jgi:protein involved in polysaccharide export with SLBB domain/capsular polysaccharide biosynthesis protein
MKNELGAKGGPLRNSEADPVDASATEARAANGNGHAGGYANGQPRAGRLDLWAVLDLLLRRWHWLVLGSCGCAGLFFLLGEHLVGPKFTATAQLLRYQLPGADFGKTDVPISAETFAGVIRSPDLLRRVGAGLKPPLEPEQLNKCIKIEPDPDSDILTVSLAARQAEQAVQALDHYTRAAVEYTSQLEAQQASKLANDYLKKQAEQMGTDLTALEKQFRALPVSPLLANKFSEVGTNLNALNSKLAGGPRPMFLIADQMRRLTAVFGELTELTSKYTELHPLVKAKREEAATLEAAIKAGSTNQNSGLGAQGLMEGMAGDSTFNADAEIIHTKLRALEDSHLELVRRLREAQLYAENPPGVVRILAPADPKTVKANARLFKILIVTLFGGLVGLGGSLGLVTVTEFADSRLKTPDDVRRVTHLPIYATLGNLNQMSPAARSHWGFRTWTMLQGRLSPSVNHGLVCGLTSSASGEGRSTWISLLAEAASLTGYRVLTIATRPSPTHRDSALDDPDAPLLEDPETVEAGGTSTALTTNVLSSPSQVTDQLTGPNSQPVVHIPLPGWVWNLERRKQWREALDHWRSIENLVILVELPPAGVPEAVLLGSNLPNMLWLADTRTADATQTRSQLETLRDARCNLVGAVLNHESSPSLKARFPRWVGCYLMATSLGLGSAQAQGTPARVLADVPTNLLQVADVATPRTDAETNAAPAPGFFSIVEPSQGGQWQKHLTLGPGDLLNLGLYGEPDLTRADLAIGPDGRVSFLEAQDILATGLTIDELREKLDQELGKYRRAPRTLVTPVAFRSKKYYMLGKVAVKGVYTLDRPITALEAIARARGIENGLVDRNIVDLADYSRSFLARGGKRYPLNFEKLFQTGDLSQNIAVEPGDYIYLASTGVGEVYVVGEVRLPGVVTYTPNLTIMQAITARGGYTDRGYKSRVLVVRGSLNHPQKIAVDTHAILDAKAKDFQLSPGDIIYVNSRPFILVEELADLAVTAFIQSVITEWVGVDVVKPINVP